MKYRIGTIFYTHTNSDVLIKGDIIKYEHNRYVIKWIFYDGPTCNDSISDNFEFKYYEKELNSMLNDVTFDKWTITPPIIDTFDDELFKI